MRRDGVNFESKKNGVKDESMQDKIDLADYSKKKTSSGNLKKVNNPLVRKDEKHW